MAKNKKITSQEKIDAVMDYLSGKRSTGQIVGELGVSKGALRLWIANYEKNGEAGLQPSARSAKRCKRYSIEVKMAAVEAYLSGNLSINDVCAKYEISSSAVLRDWLKRDDLQRPSSYKEYSDEVKRAAIEDHLNNGLTITEVTDKYCVSSRTVVYKWLKKYNNHVVSNDSHYERIDRMVKGRKTSLNERIEIVQFCIENGKDYRQANEKYQVSYQQVCTWVRKYEELGASGLEDRRGKPKAASTMTEEDILRAENKILTTKLKQAEMENELLKKIQEVGRGRR